MNSENVTRVKKGENQMKGKKILAIITMLIMVLGISISSMAVTANTKGRCTADGVAVRKQPDVIGSRLGLMYNNENIYYNPTYVSPGGNINFRYVRRTTVSMEGWSHRNYLKSYNW